MAPSKVFLSFLLINLSSYFHLSLCDGTAGGATAGGATAGGADLDQLFPGLAQSSVLQDAQCMQQLLPCQPYLKAPNNPPPTCCNPLSELAKNASDCLCNFLNNPKLFVSLEVSKDEILKLPTACGIDVDASKCNAKADKSESSKSSPSSESSAADETTTEDAAADDAATKGTTSSTKMITPYGMTYFGVPGFVALLTALVFSAY